MGVPRTEFGCVGCEGSGKLGSLVLRGGQGGPTREVRARGGRRGKGAGLPGGEQGLELGKHCADAAVEEQDEQDGFHPCGDLVRSRGRQAALGGGGFCFHLC